jgi:hypothetical protein
MLSSLCVGWIRRSPNKDKGTSGPVHSNHAVCVCFLVLSHKTYMSNSQPRLKKPMIYLEEGEPEMKADESQYCLVKFVI